MKIAIATDYRGYIPIGHNNVWAKDLSRYLKQQGHAVDSSFSREGNCLKIRKVRLCTLYSVVGELKKKQKKKKLTKFDMMICQFGMHDWILPWSKCVWKLIIPKGKFREELFKIDDFFLTAKGNFSGKIGFYEDRKLIEEYFNLLKSYTDKLILVGMHSWKYHPDMTRRYLHPRILEMNDLYSSFADSYVDLPLNFSWSTTKRSRLKGDYTHYDNRGHSLVANISKDIIDYYDVVIPDLLNKYTREIVINNEHINEGNLYHLCKKLGSFIASNTNERDIVLIAKKTSVEQIAIFLGSIIYNRIPVIIQRPSSKVHLEFFNAKMKKISNALDVAMCVCEKRDESLFDKHFNTYSSFIETEIFSAIKMNPEDTAFIQLSSGTTSLPKIMKVSHKNLIIHCLTYSKVADLKSNDSIISWLPLYHDMGMIACFMLPIICNIPFVHIDPFDWLANPRSLFDTIYKYDGTHVWMPNFAFSYLSKRVQNDMPNDYLKSLKQCISCSEMANIEDINRFRDKFIKCGLNKNAIKVCYALAENIFAVSQSSSIRSIDIYGSKLVSCGKVVPGSSVIVIKNGKDVTEQDEGDIYIKSLYMLTDDLSSFNGYYNTGDRGFIREGELFILGRSDDMIVSHGDNIFPYDIEKLVGSIEGIIEGRVACFGRFNKKIGTNEIVICAESDNPSNDLCSCISKKVQKNFGISSISCVKSRGWLIKTSSGKMSRKDVARKYENEINNR